MNPQKTEKDTLLETLDLARLAPSIHNSQPWRWRLEPRAVRLYADLRRWLPVTDQDGRDLVVSCGAALHHLRVALAAFGIAAQVHRMPDPDEPDLLAVVTTDPDALAELGLGSVEPICQRRTDRRRFNTWPVPQEFLDELVAAGSGAGRGAAAGVGSPDPAQAGRGDRRGGPRRGRHPRLPGGDRRLERTRRHPGRDTLPRTSRAPIKRPRRSRCATSATAPSSNRPTPRTAPSCWPSGTSSDDRLSQLRAGEAMSAVLLRATELELATCPLSQPLEVADTRETLRDVVLHGTLSPQLILRIGWPPAGGPAVPPTPRRPLTEIVEVLD